ncbi:retrovirus-related pol polyprotein from transposon TNT 1-94 [Tanacetum coccineum]
MLHLKSSPPASVKAVGRNIVLLRWSASVHQLFATMDNVFPKFQDYIQRYVSAAAVNYNQGNTSYRPQSIANQIRPSGFVNDSRSFPSNTIANPKGELKAITTRSGIVLDEPSVPMPLPFINPEEDERAEETSTDPELAEYTIKVPPPLVQKPQAPSQKSYEMPKRDPLHPNIPYPSRMYKEKQQDKVEIQIHKFWQMFKQLHINITLAEALILIPKYQKMLKALFSNKEKLLELANTPLNENCSAVILKKLPEKLGDPEKFLIPCSFSELNCKALAVSLKILTNGEYLRKCTFDGPYKLTSVVIETVAATVNAPAIPEHDKVETVHNMSEENKLYFKAEKEAIFLLLTGIGDEIYSTVDACNTANEMWTAIERLQQVNDIRTERIAKSANPLALLTAAQPYSDNYYQAPKPQRTNATSSSMRPSASTRHKGKKIAKPVTPQSKSVSEEDSDPEQAQRDKDMQKNLALLAKYFKKLYKPTNNNLRTSSNSRNKTEDTTPRYNNDNQSGQFGNQRTMTVAGARETVGSQVVQQTGIQCFNCKGYGHYAKECRKPKRVKDYAYHKEKMMMCKQAEQGVPLQAEQADWLEDTDEEIDEQELEAHYSYMAKIQEVSPEESSSTGQPLEQVQNHDESNVYDNVRRHSEQPESINNTYVLEKDDSNVTPDSSNICTNDNQVDQNAAECVDERAALANLIANLTLDTEENKTILKQLKKANASLTQELEKCKTNLDETILIRTNEKQPKREQYHEIQDLKAQMQDKNIAISELKKLIEKCKGKSVETQFDKPSVVRQPNAQRIPKPSVLGKPTPFSNSPEMRSFQTKQSVNKTNVSDGSSKQVTQQNLPQNRKQAEIHSNVLKPGMYRIATSTTQNREPQLPHASRNTNPHVSKSTGVNHTTSVSRPQLKCYQVKDKVVPNNSQVKLTKKEVEDHHRIFSISKKTKSVTAYNDSLNSRTSNVNAVCAECGKCVFNSNHDACVSKYLNDVNARTKKPKVVPISASKPKRKMNKSVATPHKKIVASDTTIQKPKSYFKELYENTNKAWKWWIEKKCPLEYKWTQTTPSRPSLKWKPTGKSFNGQKQQRIDLNADALYNAKQENLRVCSGLVLHQMTSDHNRSELGIQDHSNEQSSSKLVPKVVPLAVKTATSRQELELLFHHHIAMLRTTGINPMIQPEPEDLPKDNPKLEIAVLRFEAFKMRHSMRMLAKDTRSQDGINDKDNDKGSKSRSQSMKEQSYNKEQREIPRSHELNDKSNLMIS